jgi:hypothetical protein
VATIEHFLCLLLHFNDDHFFNPSLVSVSL